MTDVTTPLPTSIDIAMLLRLRMMLETVRTEIRDLTIGAGALERLATVHTEIESQLSTALPAELAAELVEFSTCCEDNPNPTKSEIRVAQAQLQGWIEGLLQGVQLSVATTAQASAVATETVVRSGDEAQIGAMPANGSASAYI